MRGLDKNSRGGSSYRNLDDRSIAQRSINFMQQRQSTASVGSRAARSAKANNLLTGDKIFQSPGCNKTEVKGTKNTEDAPYFQRRMMRSRGRRGGSQAHPGRNSGEHGDELNEYGASKTQHEHLDQFLRDQILSQNGSRQKGKQRCTVSQSSSKRSNALIELAAQAQYQKKNSARGTKRQSGDYVDTNSLVAAANVMRLSNYQADPLAATRLFVST